MIRAALALVAFVAHAAAVGPIAARAGSVGCSGGQSAAAEGEDLVVDVVKTCGRLPGSAPRDLVEYSDCGMVAVLDERRPLGDSVCSRARFVCAVSSPDLVPKSSSTIVVGAPADPASDRPTTTSCRVRAGRAGPAVSGAAVRAQVVRLLPRPWIRLGPPRWTLVNMETVMWADTPADRDLGTVRLLGRRVRLRAHVESTSWDFGDGQAQVSVGAGRRYDPAWPCRTKQCPTYFGHTYLQTGLVSINAQLRWTAQFSVDGGIWEPVPGTATSPALTARLAVKQARGVLVPDEITH